MSAPDVSPLANLMDAVFEIVGGDGHDALKRGAPSVHWLRSLVQRMYAGGVRVGVPCVRCGTPLVSAAPCATCRLLELGRVESPPPAPDLEALALRWYAGADAVGKYGLVGRTLVACADDLRAFALGAPKGTTE